MKKMNGSAATAEVSSQEPGARAQDWQQAEGGQRANLEARVQSSECRAEGPEDGELVVRAQGGEMGAFDELVLRHTRPLYCYLWRMCRNQAEAEELAQEAFVRAWEGLGRFRRQASFRTWLYRLATNLCLNRLTRTRRLAVLDETLAGPQASEPEQVHTQRVQSEMVQAALLALPADQRAALLLYAHDEMSYEEIAEVMGRTAASVNALIYRARGAVRKAMGDAK
jgi:RNA polymerase sigma-70 factor (ECF subfamily)